MDRRAAGGARVRVAPEVACDPAGWEFEVSKIVLNLIIVPEANLVLLTGLFGARANARVPTRRAGRHACTGLVHLDAKFRIRRSILGRSKFNFDLEGHAGREFEI